MLMFGFYIYAYGIASALLQYNVNNPTTGKPYDIAEIVAVSQACMMSIMTVGQIAPIFPAVVKALVCMKKVYNVIERVPLIKSQQDSISSITLKE